MDHQLRMAGLTAQQMADRALASYCSLPGANLGAEINPTLHDVVKAYSQQVQKSGGPAYNANTVDQFVREFEQVSHLYPGSGADTSSHHYKNGLANFETMTKALYAYQAIHVDRTAHSLHDLDDSDLRALRIASLTSSKRVEKLGKLLDPLRGGPMTPQQLVRAAVREEERIEPKNRALAEALERNFSKASRVSTIDPTNRDQLSGVVRSIAKAAGMQPSQAEIAATVQTFRNVYYDLDRGEPDKSLKGAPPMPPFSSR